MTTTKQTPEWLRDAVGKGIKGLMTLRLEGAPAEDTIVPMAEAWLAILATLPHTWDEDRDRLRLRHAFLSLAQASERWPAPAALIRALPPVVIAQPLLPEPRSNIVPPEFKALVQKLKAAHGPRTP